MNKKIIAWWSGGITSAVSFKLGIIIVSTKKIKKHKNKIP